IFPARERLACSAAPVRSPRAVRGRSSHKRPPPDGGAVSLEVVPMTVFVDRSAVASVEVLHARFLALVPCIETYARVYCRGMRCPGRQEDRAQECVALGWQWFVRLTAQGKDVFAFPVVFAATVARAVKCGRRLCGKERANDVLSLLAQQRHGFRVERLPSATRGPNEQLYAEPHGQAMQDTFEERLRDNTQTPVPDQAAFRIDFPLWRLSHGERDRRLIDHLLVGERTLEVSHTFGVSPARVSQKRREFRDDWLAFCGETER